MSIAMLVLFLFVLRQPRSTLFPYTTLFRSYDPEQRWYWFPRMRPDEALLFKVYESLRDGRACRRRSPQSPRDRKSTRLNSSHVEISYAVFCLKKKEYRH